MRRRRLRKEAAQLEITAFINLIVVLVPFLLSTAVFTRLAVLDLQLPTAAAPTVPPAALAKLNAETLQLEVRIRAGTLEVFDRASGPIQRIEARAAGGLDLAALNATLRDLKTRFPQHDEASVLAEPNTPYEHIVQVMDTLRGGAQPPGSQTPKPPALFPRITLGDAP